MQPVEIRIKGHIVRDWSDWLEGATSRPTPLGQTVLSGLVADQSALYGLLSRLSALGVQLISVSVVETRLGDIDEECNARSGPSGPRA